MSQPLTFYTVDTDKDGYPVRFMRPDNDYRIERMSATFGDPGEASQEFRIAVSGEHCYLDATTFQRKASALAKLRRDQAKRQEALA